LEVNVEQAEYIQTIGQGWAYPLNKFMDELQLLEVIHMKTLTDATGHRHLFSVPITQAVTKEEKESLKDAKKIALRCSAISPTVLAVIENPVFFDNRKEEISTRVFGV
jgi:3'-phosphoadenosine 5'-phosphosulfate synthase